MTEAERPATRRRRKEPLADTLNPPPSTDATGPRVDPADTGAAEAGAPETEAPVADPRREGDYRTFVMKFSRAADPGAGVRYFDVPGSKPWNGLLFGDGSKDAKPPQEVLDFLKQEEPRFRYKGDLRMWTREIDPEQPAQSRLENERKYQAVRELLRAAKGLPTAAPARSA